MNKKVTPQDIANAIDEGHVDIAMTAPAAMAGDVGASIDAAAGADVTAEMDMAAAVVDAVAAVAAVAADEATEFTRECPKIELMIRDCFSKFGVDPTPELLADLVLNIFKYSENHEVEEFPEHAAEEPLSHLL